MPTVADAISNGLTSPKDAATELPSVPVNTPTMDAPQSTVTANSTADPAFLEVCEAFPDYSEDLLRSMLVCAALFKIVLLVPISSSSNLYGLHVPQYQCLGGCVCRSQIFCYIP